MNCAQIHLRVLSSLLPRNIIKNPPPYFYLINMIYLKKLLWLELTVGWTGRPRSLGLNPNKKFLDQLRKNTTFSRLSDNKYLFHWDFLNLQKIFSERKAVFDKFGHHLWPNYFSPIKNVVKSLILIKQLRIRKFKVNHSKTFFLIWNI